MSSFPFFPLELLSSELSQFVVQVITPLLSSYFFTCTLPTNDFIFQGIPFLVPSATQMCA